MIPSVGVVLDFLYLLIPNPVVILTVRTQASLKGKAGGSEDDAASYTLGRATRQQAGQDQRCSICLPIDL